MQKIKDPFFDDAVRNFEWLDKHGEVWDVFQVEDASKLLDLYALPAQPLGGRGEIHVETNLTNGQPQDKAFLIDLQVANWLENRGAGSMLVKEAIAECKRRGNKGIRGNLSSSDEDHFDKLKYFYDKLGFTVRFFEPNRPGYSRSKMGEVEMIF